MAIASCGSSIGVGDLGQVLVAEEGVAVDRHLGVERDDLAVGGDDQRVDLDQASRPRSLATSASFASTSAAWSRTSSSSPAASTIGARRRGVEGPSRVDVALDQRVGVLRGDRLDVHPALGGDHRQQLLLAAVEDHRGVVLGGDVRAALDPDLVDPERALAVRPDDVHAEDRVGVRRAPRSASAAILIPPALPRPPISTWALIAQG